MRVGIDARPLQGETQYRGIGKSLDNLLKILARDYFDAHSYVFYVDGDIATPPIIKEFPNSKIKTVASPKVGRKRYVRSVLNSYKKPNPTKKDVDVFLQYDASLGVPTSVPCVTEFYDLIPLLFKDKEKQNSVRGVRKYKNSLARNLYWKKYMRTLKQYKYAEKLIAISEVSKQDYLNYTGFKQDVKVVHLGTTGFDKSEGASKEVEKLATKPFIMYVGGIDTRKNVVALIDTFYDLKATFPDLRLLNVGKEFGLDDLLGDQGWHEALSANPKYAKDVLTPGFISDEDLAWLYAKAMAFVFPSRYEGFGLPVLEAMQAGCPVVAYDNSSIPEVAGDAALLVKDGESLVPALQKVLGDKELRQTLITKGKQRASEFTWEKTAKETLAVLEEVAG
jgi:glycosyltransferase involved in cell wall biosynthesis